MSADSPAHAADNIPIVRQRVNQKEDAQTRVKRLMAEAKSHNKSWRSPSATFKSATPRLQPASKPSTEAMYSIDRPTQTLKRQSSWAASKTPQRTGVKATTDAFYDPKAPEEMRYIQRGTVSIPSTPRMPPPSDNKVPPVGSYTSPYISCGMGM